MQHGVYRASKAHIARGRVQQIKVDELDMSHGGGTFGGNRRLRDGSYLTETLTTEERRSVLLPMSRTKQLWDVLIAVLVIWTALILPIELCYDDMRATMPENLVAFDVFTDVVFILDVILNFHVGYIDRAIVVVDKVAIRRKYLSRWFAIDAIGSFPGDTIFLFIDLAEGGGFGRGGLNSTLETGSSAGNQQASMIQLFKILKVPKLMRIGRLLKTLEKLEGAANVANIFILLVIVLVLTHWLSCFWFLLTKGSGGWVAAAGLDGLPWTEQYPETFYTTLMMIMGDSIDPVTHGEYILSSLLVVIGVTMNATVFASIASYASQISADTAVHKNKMSSIQHSLKSLELDKNLSERIQQYYEYCCALAGSRMVGAALSAHCDLAALMEVRALSSPQGRAIGTSRHRSCSMSSRRSFSGAAR